MIGPFEWPALELGQQPLPTHLNYERGVWGKAHAASTDYRWMARSPDFNRQPEYKLESELNLGNEERPIQMVMWRTLREGDRDRCYAVACYPSRASDASGRQQFLEKQVLEWCRPAEVPAALGALLLLPRVSGLTDEIWWEQRSALADPDIILPIAPSDQEVPIDEHRLEMAIEHGLAALREAVDETALERFYLDLLSEQRPAGLTGLGQPLPPEALAALLLPLPRDRTDRISLAGWIPSSRGSLTDFAQRWDALVLPKEYRLPGEPSAGEALRISARKMAQQLLNIDLTRVPELFSIDSTSTVSAAPSQYPEKEPPRTPSPRAPVRPELPRPSYQLDLQPPPKGSPELLQELYRFAISPESRWLNAKEWGQKWEDEIARFDTRGIDNVRVLFVSWIQDIENQKPSYANEKQWRVKLDILRSAALVLAPSPATYMHIGLPQSGYVPALFLGLALQGKQKDGLGKLGEKALRETIDQSLRCSASPRTREIRRWLESWQKDTRLAIVRSLIELSFKDHSGERGKSSSAGVL